MIYDISLRISYRYTSPAIGGRHLARLIPADGICGQRLIATRLDISPQPDERVDRTDFFGNHATDFAFRGALDEVALHLRARVDRHGPPPVAFATPRQALGAEIAADRRLSGDAPVHFLAPSPLVQQDAAIAAYALAASGGTESTLEAVEALGRALNRDMLYDPGSTEVDTPMTTAFAGRHGVCQDFSHIMIAGLRSLGIPAGYVSGFLRTAPPPGQARLEGADAMHAWVDAWCGARAGWVGYDPTNAIPAGTDHIVVARGRDYSDVSPIKGVLRASGSQTGAQAVDVIPLSP